LKIIQLLHETLLLAPPPFAMIMFQICRNSGDMDEYNEKRFYTGQCCHIERSVKHGLKLRPLAVTAHDTLQWFKSEPQERLNKLQLKLERDEKILQTWHNRGE
jgi:hypothetical protein